MSQAKTESRAIAPLVVLNEYKRLELEVLTATRKGNLSHQLVWFDHLPSRDQEYLSLWFAPRR
jgi:hypothetical protein